MRVQALARGWTEVDDPGLFGFLIELRSGPIDRFASLRVDFEGAMVDQERYAELAAMMGEQPELFAFVQSALNGRMLRAWAERDPEAAFAWADGLSHDVLRAISLKGMLESVAETDPARAMQLAESADERSKRPQSESEVLRIWAGADPAAALTWLETHDGGIQGDSLVAAFVTGAASKAPELAGPLVPLVAEDEDRVDTLMCFVASENPPLAAEWLVAYGLQVEARTRRQVFGRWIRTDLEAARAFILNDPRLSDETRTELKKLLPGS